MQKQIPYRKIGYGYQEKEQVTLKLNGQWLTNRSHTIQSEQFKAMDGAFIKDQYWLIFPLRTAWDNGTEVSIGNDIMPFTSDSVPSMPIAYTDSTGYTPINCIWIKNEW
ncbi:MAG: hypothetical protein ACJAT1_000830 [Marivirga sp.]|jgi:hypothetical protein